MARVIYVTKVMAILEQMQVESMKWESHRRQFLLVWIMTPTYSIRNWSVVKDSPVMNKVELSNHRQAHSTPLIIYELQKRIFGMYVI